MKNSVLPLIKPCLQSYDMKEKDDICEALQKKMSSVCYS